MLGFDLAQFFLGAQIDRAQPLAVAPQLFEIFLDLGKRRQFRARFDLGQTRHGLRLDFQHVVDFALDVDQPALGAVHAFFGAGAGLARARQRFERNLGGAVGLRHRGLGGGQRIGGDAAGVLGRSDFADQRVAFFRENRRRILEFGALGLDLGDAGFDGSDLRGRARLAVLPLVALGGDRLQAAVGQFGLARQRLGFGPHLRRDAAMTVDLGANLDKPGFGVETGRQLVERRMRALECALGLGAVGVRRERASVSADFRAAWRLISRSVAA